jgi:drug/metabolite transporter (DMT)-like permease
MWALGYVLSEKLLKQGYTPAFMILVTSVVGLPIYFFISYLQGNLSEQTLRVTSDYNAALLMFIIAITVVGGSFMILMSVNEKNATLAALIEICYPLFTFVFAWLILKEVQLNWYSAIGAFLIVSGMAIIYIKS